MGSRYSETAASTPAGAFSEAREEEIVFAAAEEEESPGSNGEEVSPAAQAAEVPEWFSRKRAKAEAAPSEDAAGGDVPAAAAIPPPLPARIKTAERPRKIRIESKEVAEGEQPNWTRRIVAWIVSLASAAYLASLLFHLGLLTVLSLIIYLDAGIVGNAPINTAFSEAPGEELQLVEIADTRLDVPEPNIAEAVPSELQPVTGVRSDESMSLPADLVQNLQSMLPVSGNAVRKGSFTAWTVPEDPLPGQDYHIVIQVELPKSVRNYTVNDLSGCVIGTDNYVAPLGYHDGRTRYRGREFPKRIYGTFDASSRQLIVRVWGAQKNVRDTIQIESKLLKEKQTLEIEF